MQTEKTTVTTQGFLDPKNHAPEKENYRILLEDKCQEHCPELLRRKLSPTTPPGFFGNDLIQFDNVVLSLDKSTSRVAWTTETAVDQHHSYQGNLLFPVDKNWAFQKCDHNSSWIDLICYSKGCNVTEAEEFLCETFNLKNEPLNIKKETYPSSTFISQKELQNITYHKERYNKAGEKLTLTKTVKFCDTAGRACGMIELYHDNSRYYTIPYWVKEHEINYSLGYPIPMYKRELGFSEKMFSFYNRDAIYLNNDVTLIVTDNIFLAMLLNEEILDKSKYLATAWYGNNTTLKHTNFTDLACRNIILILSNNSKKYINSIEDICIFTEVKNYTYIKSPEKFLDIILNETSVIKQYGAINNLLRDTTKNPLKTCCNEKKEIPLIQELKNKIQDVQKILPQKNRETNIIPFWDHMIRKDLTCLIYADTEVGKTFFTFALAYNLASGKSFLDIKNNTPHSVLYIDGETAHIEHQIRIERICTDTHKNNLHCLCTKMFDNPLSLNDTETRAELKKELEKYDYVIIDNLLSLAPNVTKSQNEWNSFKQWLDSLNTAIILVHHENNEGKLKGISDIKSLIPTVIHLKKPDTPAPGKGAFCKVEFEKCKRYGQIEPFLAFLDQDSMEPWQRFDSTEQITEQNSDDLLKHFDKSDLRADAIKILRFALSKSDDNFTRQEAEVIIGKGSSTTTSRINELIEKGYLLTIGPVQNRSYKINLPNSAK